MRNFEGCKRLTQCPWSKSKYSPLVTKYIPFTLPGANSIILIPDFWSNNKLSLISFYFLLLSDSVKHLSMKLMISKNFENNVLNCNNTVKIQGPNVINQNKKTH